MKITIKNLSKEKPKYPYDIKICRPMPLGNPFYLDDVNDDVKRDKVCDQYEKWFYDNMDSLRPILERLKKIFNEYGQLNLFCWCAPKRCHAETIKKWLENN